MTKEQEYKNYIEEIAKEDYEIKKDDLINFIEEYNFAPYGSGQFTAYMKLTEDYQNSKLLDEIIRMGKIIQHTNDIAIYEGLNDLSKDKNYTVNLTEDNKKEYEKSKSLIDKLKKPFDFDCEKQYEILEKTFQDKYISDEIFKEYKKLHIEDYLEETDEEEM